MKRSVEHILTTHTGSLPSPSQLVEVMFAKEEGKNVDPQLMDQRVRDAVREVVKHQHDCGIAVVSDGEMSKLSYATYVTERLSGFGGKSDRPKLPAHCFVSIVTNFTTASCEQDSPWKSGNEAVENTLKMLPQVRNILKRPKHSS